MISAPSSWTSWAASSAGRVAGDHVEGAVGRNEDHVTGHRNSRTTMPKNPARPLFPKLIGLASLPREWMAMPMLPRFERVPDQGNKEDDGQDQAEERQRRQEYGAERGEPENQGEHQEPHADPA